MDAVMPCARISRGALLHNIRVIRRAVPEGVKLCAVVKADAYGHGAKIVADALTNFSSGPLEGPAVDMLAVATLEEAEALGPVEVPVLVMRPVENGSMGPDRPALGYAIRQGWILTIASAEGAGEINRIAMAVGRPAAVNVMVDVGMRREGAALRTLPWIVSAIRGGAALQLAGIGTHFTSADEPGNPATALQLARFEAAAERFVQEMPGVLRHAANSGAMFFTPESHLDMVRPGLSVYGIDPAGAPSVDRALRPVMKWVAPLALVRSVREGEAAGYGQTWRALRDTRIGLVPVGYADGYLRALSNKGVMMVRGKAAPVVGRVSMDYVTIDLHDVPDAATGDEVTVIDSDPLSPASVYRLAESAGTIAYELFTRIGARIRRVAVEPVDAPAVVPIAQPMRMH